MELKGRNNTLLTQGLFYEFNNKEAPFTLRTEDYTSRAGNSYKSVYQVLMNSADEYEAIHNLGLTKRHWDKLCGLDWFMNGHWLNKETRLSGLTQWRKDLILRDQSTAKRALLNAIESGDTSAAKFLYSETVKSDAKAGRPEKKVPKKTTSSAVTQLRKIQGVD